MKTLISRLGVTDKVVSVMNYRDLKLSFSKKAEDNMLWMYVYKFNHSGGPSTDIRFDMDISEAIAIRDHLDALIKEHESNERP